MPHYDGEVSEDSETEDAEDSDDDEEESVLEASDHEAHYGRNMNSPGPSRRDWPGESYFAPELPHGTCASSSQQRDDPHKGKGKEKVKYDCPFPTCSFAHGDHFVLQAHVAKIHPEGIESGNESETLVGDDRNSQTPTPPPGNTGRAPRTAETWLDGLPFLEHRRRFGPDEEPPMPDTRHPRREPERSRREPERSRREPERSRREPERPRRESGRSRPELELSAAEQEREFRNMCRRRAAERERLGPLANVRDPSVPFRNPLLRGKFSGPAVVPDSDLPANAPAVGYYVPATPNMYHSHPGSAHSYERTCPPLPPQFGGVPSRGNGSGFDGFYAPGLQPPPDFAALLRQNNHSGSQRRNW